MSVWANCQFQNKEKKKNPRKTVKSVVKRFKVYECFENQNAHKWIMASSFASSKVSFKDFASGFIELRLKFDAKPKFFMRPTASAVLTFESMSSTLWGSPWRETARHRTVSSRYRRRCRTWCFPCKPSSSRRASVMDGIVINSYAVFVSTEVENMNEESKK